MVDDRTHVPDGDQRPTTGTVITMTSSHDTHDRSQTDDRTYLLPADDGVVIYDVETPSGWLRSDHAVALAEWR